MKLTIFGATGGVGRELVEQACAAGHEVTVLTRNPDRFETRSPKVTVIKGDVRDADAVAKAVHEAEAVLCALGMPLMNREGLRTAGTLNIIKAMVGAGVNRLICLSALGTGDSRATLPWHYKYLLMPTMMRWLYLDHGAQERAIMESPLDWTIVRPGNFIDGPRTGDYRHGFTAPDRSLKIKVSRADVADFMLRQLTDDTYRGRAAALSY